MNQYKDLTDKELSDHLKEHQDSRLWELLNELFTRRYRNAADRMVQSTQIQNTNKLQGEAQTYLALKTIGVELNINK